MSLGVGVRKKVVLTLVFLSFLLSARGQTNAPLPLRPSGIAFDSAGDLFFTDSRRHQVYEVTLAGKLLVVAGNGVQGFSGDGGPASAAELNEPHGIAVGSDGTIFVADTGNARVRTIRAGTIATAAGSGTPGYNGDSAPAAAGQLQRPVGLALGADGSLFIADSGNERVRLLRSGTLSTVAGNGRQGAGGDGGPALKAQLDMPEQVALASDGRLFIADAHNGIVRVVSTEGTISTFAGSGAQGFAGDGGPALRAKLSRPEGIALSAKGELYLADSGNQRIRAVDSSGIIRTLAGSGSQGATTEGAAATAGSLDGPESLAVSPFGLLWFSDARNGAVRALNADGLLFQSAGLVQRTTTLSLAAGRNAGGQITLAVQAGGLAGAPHGRVRVSENGSVLTETALADGAASVSLASLATGAHTLLTEYGGDVLNPAATASATVTSEGLTLLTATAAAVSTRYGEDIPVLSGSLAGVAPQDAGKVLVSFSTAATALSPVGVYPIVAVLSSAAATRYTVQNDPASGQLTISPQPSKATMLLPAPVGYEGLPLTLSAIVSAAGRGAPTGTVSFTENGLVLTTVPVVNGSATAVLPAYTVGSHAFVARYAGDGNFLPSESTMQQVVVNTLPDFVFARLGNDVPVMNPGSSASFSLQVSAVPAPFTGAVTFATSALPNGWVARFAPANVVPGTGSASTTLTLTASGTAGLRRQAPPVEYLAVLLLPCSFLARRRGRKRLSVVVASLPLSLVLLAGCGDRVASTADLVPPHPASLRVTATATNLAGQVITHAVVISYLQP